MRDPQQRPARRGTSRHTEAAAAALQDWLQSQAARARTDRTAAAAITTLDPDLPGGLPSRAPRPDFGAPHRPPEATLPTDATAAPPLRLAHTDWLHHRLTVSGPADQLAALRTAAAGTGVIPWQLDLDRLAEDLFHRLIAPPAPQQRSLSAAGARILAGQLRDAVARRHAMAVARVGQSRACPFDLHALLPVPAALLRRGPDDAAALAWLWIHWGITDALRHVTAVDTAFPDEAVPPACEAVFRVTFWSADWSPWRALAQLAAQWPALRFALRPDYAAA